MTGVTSCPPTQFETKIMATRCLETEAGFLKFSDIPSYLKICAYFKKNYIGCHYRLQGEYS
jgi:hypothetical protein